MGDGSTTNSTRKGSLLVLASWENLEGNNSPTAGKQMWRVGQTRLGGCGPAIGCVWVVGGSVTGLRGVMSSRNWASCGAWL